MRLFEKTNFRRNLCSTDQLFRPPQSGRVDGHKAESNLTHGSKQAWMTVAGESKNPFLSGYWAEHTSSIKAHNVAVQTLVEQSLTNCAKNH